jgi:hypothetical protein
MPLFPARSVPSALAVVGVVVLLPLTLVCWGLGLAGLWLCDRVCWPLPPPKPQVPDVDTLTDYTWAQPPTRDR